MLAQSDDVLDAVQRQRSRAVAAGYLTSNEAQVVDRHERHHLDRSGATGRGLRPSYDASDRLHARRCTARAGRRSTAATGYVAPANLLTTGAIAFGSALLVDEIFDDDDD